MNTEKKEATLEAILAPPKPKEGRYINGHWYMWLQHEWRLIFTKEEIAQMDIDTKQTVKVP